MRGYSRCLIVVGTSRTNHGRLNTPEQMPLVLVEPLTAPCEPGAPSQHDWPKPGHVEANLLDELAARGLFG